MTEAAPDWRTAGWPIPVTTGFDFADFEVRTTIGAVSGVYATSLGFARGFTAGFTALARGEVPQMTELLAEARHHALARLRRRGPAPRRERARRGPLRLQRGQPGPDRRDPLLRHRRRARGQPGLSPRQRPAGPSSSRRTIAVQRAIAASAAARSPVTATSKSSPRAMASDCRASTRAGSGASPSST